MKSFMLAGSIIGIAAAMTCSLLDASEPVGAASGRVTRPISVSTSYRIYVTNEMSGDLSIIELDKDVRHTRIALGKRPRGLGVSADGRQLFVALSGSPVGGPHVDERTLPPPDKKADGIGVVDTSTSKLVRILRGVSDPEQVAWGSNRLYIASEDAGKLVVTDIQHGTTLAEVDVGREPEGVAVSPDGTLVLVTSEADNRVAVVDAKTHQLKATIAVGTRPRSVAFSPDGKHAYVTSELEPSVNIIELASLRRSAEIPLTGEGVRPMGIVVAADGSRLYVTTGRGGTLVCVDPWARKIIGSLPTGPRPWGVALSPDGKLLFTANGPSNDISVIEVATFKIVAKIAVGERPWGVLAVTQRRSD